MARTDMSKMLDPMALWRDALAQWEGGADSAATKQMASEEFAQALHAMASVSTGIQQALGKANGALLQELNLPSRNDITEISARLQRIEDALEQLTQRLGGAVPVPAAAAEPRQMPPRTRKPPGVASATTPMRPEPVEALRPTRPGRAKARRADAVAAKARPTRSNQPARKRATTKKA